MKVNLLFILLFFLQIQVFGQDTISKENFIFFPGSYKKWDYKFSTGVSLTRLPNDIIEEEINSLPMLNGDFKMGLPKKFMLHSKINANYISNMFSIGLQKSIIDKKNALAMGINTSFWFGQLYQDVIRLRAIGFVFNPYIIGGIHFKDFYLSLKFENQFSTMKTFSDDAMLGTSRQPNSAYSLQFVIEQPLWNNHWVAMGVKLNYATFNYQSWLTYSAIDKYLLYPEYSFAFIF
jgi:hypothetical protein